MRRNHIFPIQLSLCVTTACWSYKICPPLMMIRVAKMYSIYSCCWSSTAFSHGFRRTGIFGSLGVPSLSLLGICRIPFDHHPYMSIGYVHIKNIHILPTWDLFARLNHFDQFLKGKFGRFIFIIVFLLGILLVVLVWLLLLNLFLWWCVVVALRFPLLISFKVESLDESTMNSWEDIYIHIYHSIHLPGSISVDMIPPTNTTTYLL